MSISLFTSQHRLIETLTLLTITILGIINGQVTVFYVIYLFWFHELIRTIVDTYFIYKHKKISDQSKLQISEVFSGYFILFVYLIFIVALFGFMLNFKYNDLFTINIQVFLFRNWFFNINIILFAIEYIYYRKNTNNEVLSIKSFNPRHIILHVSIILGGIISMFLKNRLNLDISWVNTLTVIPFLLLKIFFYKAYDKPSQNINM